MIRKYLKVFTTLSIITMLVGCGSAKETSVMNEIGAIEETLTGNTDISEQITSEVSNSENAGEANKDILTDISEAETSESVKNDSSTSDEKVSSETKTEEVKDSNIDWVENVITSEKKEEITTSKKEPETTNKEETTTEKVTEKETTVHTHSYSSKVTKAATCTDNGIKTYTCNCGDTYTENIAKTNHTSSDWIITKEATCSANGTKVRNCTACGKQTASETIASNGSHNYAWVTNGDTRTMTCSGCNNTSITEYKFGDVWGYFDDDTAEQLWIKVNSQRNSTRTNTFDDWGNVIDTITVASLNKNDDLYTKARTRAIEAAINFNHGGEEHECLAWGYGTAVEVKSAWVASSSHRKAMTSTAYSIGGVAWFWYDSDNSGTNLTPIAVLELGY